MPHPPHTHLAHIGSRLIPDLDIEGWVGQRSVSFRFALEDGITAQKKGDLTPLRDPTPTLLHDSTRTISRSVSFSLGVQDADRIDVIRDRVKIFITINTTEYPLGRYLFIDRTDALWTSGVLANLQLADEMFTVDQPITQGFDPGGLNVVDAIRKLLRDFTIEIDIENSGVEATGSWPAGTSRARVLNELCTQGGFFAPWFDHAGTLQIINSFDPIDREFSVNLDAGNQVIRGTISNNSDLLNAPNRFVVISNGASSVGQTAPVYGTYDVPASAPHSIQNRGFVIAKVEDIQLASRAQAVTAARKIGLTNTISETVTLSTATDPRHDGYNVVLWQADKWLELGWGMNLAPGGPMTHVMRKAYE